jgi:hypothetical protein
MQCDKFVIKCITTLSHQKLSSREYVIDEEGGGASQQTRQCFQEGGCLGCLEKRIERATEKS